MFPALGHAGRHKAGCGAEWNTMPAEFPGDHFMHFQEENRPDEAEATIPSCRYFEEFPETQNSPGPAGCSGLWQPVALRASDATACRSSCRAFEKIPSTRDTRHGLMERILATYRN
jgi:hypothetical protein